MAPLRSSPPPGLPERRRPRGGAAIGVGLLGCGTVGGGVMRLLSDNARYFGERVGVPLEVRRVLVRDLDKPRVGVCPPELLTTNPNDVLDDSAVELVVEVMGGEDLAGTFIERALASGRSVVTANKALLAKKGPHLLDLAGEHRVDLAFEAAVGGGIPIVRTLRDAFASDEVTEIVGILNGTSNYILTQMSERGEAFADALRGAQEKGYAEADPTLDVGGFDAAQKLLVLAMIAFGARAEQSEISIEGISRLEPADIRFADRFGFAVKHLVIGRDRPDGLELRAHPALIKKSSVLTNVSGALNAIKLEGRALGPCLLSGRGAGDMPTAVSVVADMLDVARSIVAGVPGLSTRGRTIAKKPLFPIGETRVRYYLRFSVADRPGVMGKLAGALGEAGVSIEQIVQTKEGVLASQPDAAEVIMITHIAREADLRAALVVIDAFGFLSQPPMVIRIEDV
jgi:homoserine dehydrogenase